MSEEMSKTFQRAFSAAYYNLDFAIEMYDIEIAQNDPQNFVAWNNRGVCKVEKGVKEKSKDLIQDGKNDIQKAIELANAEDSYGYPLAEDSLKWADTELQKL